MGVYDDYVEKNKEAFNEYTSVENGAISVTATDDYSYYSMQNANSNNVKLNLLYWHNAEKDNGDYSSSGLSDSLYREEAVQAMQYDLQQELLEKYPDLDYTIFASGNAYENQTENLSSLIPDIGSSDSINVYMGFSNGHYGALKTLGEELKSSDYNATSIYVNINGSYSDESFRSNYIYGSDSYTATVGQNHIPAIYIGGVDATTGNYARNACEQSLIDNGSPVYIVPMKGSHDGGTGMSGYSATMFANGFVSSIVSDTELTDDSIVTGVVQRYYSVDENGTKVTYYDELTYEQFKTMVQYDASKASELVETGGSIEGFDIDKYNNKEYNTILVNGNKFVSNVPFVNIFNGTTVDADSVSTINYDVIKNCTSDVLGKVVDAGYNSNITVNTGAARDSEINDALSVMDGVTDVFQNKIRYEFCVLASKCSEVYGTMDSSLSSYANSTLNTYLGGSVNGDYTSSFDGLSTMITQEFNFNTITMFDSSSTSGSSFGEVSIEGINRTAQNVNKFVCEQIIGLTGISTSISDFSSQIVSSGMDQDHVWSEVCRKAQSYADICQSGIDALNAYNSAEQKAASLIGNYLSSYGYSSINSADLPALCSERTRLTNLNVQLEEAKWVNDYDENGKYIGRHIDEGIQAQIEANTQMIEELSKEIECIEGYPEVEAQARAIEEEALANFWNTYGDLVSELDVGAGNIEYQAIALSSASSAWDNGTIIGVDNSSSTTSTETNESGSSNDGVIIYDFEKYKVPGN